MADKITLGKNCIFSTDMKKTGINNNVTVIGSTGSGKTVSIVIPHILNTYNSSLVLTDPKRELIEKYSPLFKSRGYNVQEINLDNPFKGTTFFDPIAYIEKDSDFSALADAFVTIRPDAKSVDRFWDDASKNMIEFFLRYAKEKSVSPSLKEFTRYLRDTRVTEDYNSPRASLSVEREMDTFAYGNPEHPLSKCFLNMREVAGKTILSVIVSARNIVSGVITNELEVASGKMKSIDIRKMAKNRTVLFITSSGTSNAIEAFTNIIYNTLITKLMDIASEFPEGVLPVPVRLILDDFACSSTIASFPQQIAKFRSKGICSTVILQDESQLVTMYSESGARTVINNADTLVYLGGNDVFTASEMARRLDVPLTDILYMPLNEVVIFRRGSKPIKTQRYDTFEDPVFKKAKVLYEKTRTKENTASLLA